MDKKNILIVDDQKEILLLLSSALETLPYDFEIFLALSGEEAMLEAIMNPIDLLISDIRLPGMDGFEVMDSFKKQHTGCKIILISGLQEESIKRQIAQAGASAFFFKPIVLSDFLDTVERTLGLVETMLPKEIEAFKDDQFEDITPPPDLIANLRNEINANAVLLIDAKGDISSSAGNLHGEFRTINQTEDILSLVFSPILACENFDSAVDENCNILKIKDTYFLFSTVSTNYGLIIQATQKPTEAEVTAVIKTQMTLRQQLSRGTGELLKAQKAVEKKEEDVIPVDTKMESVIVEQKIQTERLHNFWEESVEEAMHTTNKEGLSYEQAKILGLTPK